MSSGLDESYSALLAARLLNATQRPVHIVWDPTTGGIVQMVSAATTAPYRGIPEALLIMALGPEPFTAQPCMGLWDIMTWIRGFGIPDVFPLGPQGLDPQPIGPEPGHYCQAGSIDSGRLFRP